MRVRIFEESDKSSIFSEGTFSVNCNTINKKNQDSAKLTVFVNLQLLFHWQRLWHMNTWLNVQIRRLQCLSMARAETICDKSLNLACGACDWELGMLRLPKPVSRIYFADTSIYLILSPLQNGDRIWLWGLIASQPLILWVNWCQIWIPQLKLHLVDPFGNP